jgi:hypothetical protein
MAEIPDALLRQITATLDRARVHLISEAVPEFNVAESESISEVDDLENTLLAEVEDLLFLLRRYSVAHVTLESDDSDVDSIAIG